HLSPTLLLCCCWQLAHVYMLHPVDLVRPVVDFKISQAGSIKARERELTDLAQSLKILVSETDWLRARERELVELVQSMENSRGWRLLQAVRKLVRR
ncbi:hypothetical protein, partial [Microvirga tunisiensis]|uniref:hypothetical protein n=1 Tax=Microvirga tunisiensis TaxID=2108360 RepID=UPI001AEE4E8A